MSEPKTYVLKTASPATVDTWIVRREISEMLGACRGIVADGVVTPEEVQFLESWLASHPLAAVTFPGNVIAARLRRIYADGLVTDQERADLLALLQDATGQTSPTSVTAPTSLPLSDPAPPIAFEGASFCFTGKFASGTRAWCESEIIARGGNVSPVMRSLSYLVVGSVGSANWAHSSFGTKIENAVKLRAGGASLAVISEQHWCEALRSATAGAPTKPQ